MDVETIIEASKNRHAVRSFTDQKIEGDVKTALLDEIAQCNRESGLNIQLVTDDSEAFTGMMAKYGKFVNVRNYVAMIGKKGDGLDINVGYYGERIVLLAQALGLNSCWVGLSYSKKKTKCVVGKDEKRVCVIALGYGTTQGVQHRNKDLSAVSKCDGDAPQWFTDGVTLALNAPTALNQQKFFFELDGNKVKAGTKKGAYTGVDLGIAKYHFELGAGKDNFEWF